jgi:hypothetical protein
VDRETLEGYLSQARSEGKFDSAGTFTIDYAQAREKLAAFQFQRPEYYLLKFVQAAVAMKSTAVEFRFAPESVEVRFVNPRFQLPPEQFGALITDSYEAHIEQHCRDLALAVCGSGAGTICFRDTGSGREVNIQGRALEFTELGSLKGDSKFLFFLSRDKAYSKDEIKAKEEVLRAACQFAPVTLKVDGKPLNESRADLRFYERCLDSPYPVFWGEVIVAETNRTGVGLPRHGRSASVELWDDRRVCREQAEVWVRLRDSEPVECPLDRVRLLCLAGGALEGRSTLYLVQYGVVISEQTILTSVPGLNIVLCVDGHPTDLSGFQLRDSELLEQELKQIYRLSDQLKERLMGELSHGEPEYLRAPPEPGQSAVVGGVLIGGVIGLVAGPYGSFFGACSGAALAKVFQNSRAVSRTLPGAYLLERLSVPCSSGN